MIRKKRLALIMMVGFCLLSFRVVHADPSPLNGKAKPWIPLLLLFELPAVQLTYEFNLDDETIASIGRGGGEARLEAASGTGITLSIPPNAVLNEL